jgi:hypothetical protein
MLDIIIEIIGFNAYGAGEIILYAVTWGRHKPVLPHRRKESGFNQELLSAFSTRIGLIFWGAVLALVAFLILQSDLGARAFRSHFEMADFIKSFLIAA